MSEKIDPEMTDDVTVLRKRIAELESNEIKLKQMEKMIQAKLYRPESILRDSLWGSVW